MLSQLSYFPTWAPQRGVAWYVCHSCAGVKSFLRAARPAAGGMAAVTGRAGLPRDPAPPGERLPLVLRLLADPARPGASRRKGKRLPARGRGRRGQRAVPVARVVFPGALFCGCGPYPCRGARETAMPRQGLPAGNVRTGQSAGRPSRDRLPPAMRCKKIGRAAPVGLGYREKKRYRSPLVSL